MDREHAGRSSRKAEIALATGDFDRALAIYSELERTRPNDGSWSHRIADIHRRRGDHSREILALIRAADRYLAEGAPLKSLVMCKRLLEIAPDLPDAERCLAALHPMLVANSAPERPKRFEITVSLEDWLPVGAPLDEASLAKALPVAEPEQPSFPVVLELPSDVIAPLDLTEIESIGGSQRAEAVVAAPPLEVPPRMPEPQPEDDWTDVNMAIDLAPPEAVHQAPLEWAGGDISVKIEAEPLPPESPAAQPAQVKLVAPPLPQSAVDRRFEDSPPPEVTPPPAPIDSRPVRTGDLAGWSFRMTPLFAALSEPTFRQLVKKLRIAELHKDQILFRQGSPGESLFMICMGKVAVVKEGPPEVELARLEDAEFFGEIALVTNHPRTATVRALENTLLIEIDRHMVSELIYEDSGIMPVLLWFLRDRLVDTLVRTSPLFERFPYDRRRELADRFRLLESYKDTPVIEQGQRSKGLVIVLAGHADVVRKIEDREIHLAKLGSGDVAGEMSLLTWEPAVATVTTRGHFIGLFLPADDFKQVAIEHPIFMRDLERLAEVRRQKLVAALDAQSWPETNLPLV